MTRDHTRREEWHRLHAERAAARAELVSALDALDARARDPFGLKEKFRKHPVLFAGAAAGAAALLAGLIARGGSGREPSADDAARAPRRDEPSPLVDALREAAMRLALPWITRFLAEHLGQEVDLGDHAGNADRRDAAATPRN